MITRFMFFAACIVLLYLCIKLFLNQNLKRWQLSCMHMLIIILSIYYYKHTMWIVHKVTDVVFWLIMSIFILRVFMKHFPYIKIFRRIYFTLMLTKNYIRRLPIYKVIVHQLFVI